jgi:hypothetical protein
MVGARALSAGTLEEGLVLTRFILGVRRPRATAKAASDRLSSDCPQSVPAAPEVRLEAVEQAIDAATVAFTCRIWYSTSRTVSDDDVHRLTLTRSALSQSSPAPSARRNAALGLDCSARPSKSSGRADIALTTICR